MTRRTLCVTAVCLLLATAAACGDEGGSEEGSLSDEQRICEKVGRDRNLGTYVSLRATTAGEIVRSGKLLNQDVPKVWAEADSSHEVAACSFVSSSGEDRTVRCSDGDLYSTALPVTLLADAEGRVTEDVTAKGVMEDGACPDGKPGVPAD